MRRFLFWSLISVTIFGHAFAQQAAPPPSPAASGSTSSTSPSSAPVSAAAPGAPASASSNETVPKHLVEQYKAYVADLGSVGSQAATTFSFYLTIISGLIAVVALKKANRPMEEYFATVPIVVFIIIALVCWTWWLTAQSFASIFAAKFFVLREMESKISGLYPMFTVQSERYNSARGILGDQSWLIGVVGLGALSMAVAGIGWRIKKRLERRSRPAVFEEIVDPEM
jgi:hypothetical protein